MNKVKFFGAVSLDMESDKNVEVYVDALSPSPIPPDTIRILILQEVFRSNVAVDLELNDFVHKRPDLYTFVCTHRDEILSSNPKAKFLMATSSWVQGYVSLAKTFRVSTLVGGKRNPVLEGYAIRHDVWKLKSQIAVPIDFYLSSHCPWLGADSSNQKVLGDSKTPLFDSQFHIAIENTSIKNMFTEKLIDCFQTKTVPIYRGCINVGDFFNVDGILVARTAQEIIDVCNNLTSETYEKMLPAIEDNYNRSHKYCVYQEQIKNAILELI
jgi:hypothetical protein